MTSAFGSEGPVLQVTANRVRWGQVTLCHGWLLNAFWIMARFSSHFALASISKAAWCNSEENLKISEFRLREAEMFLRVCRWREGTWQMCIVNNPSDNGEMLPPIFSPPLCRVRAQSSDMFWGSALHVIHFWCCHYLQWMTSYAGDVVNPPTSKGLFETVSLFVHTCFNQNFGYCAGLVFWFTSIFTLLCLWI